MDIKPIETLYKGHRFRSRLEARWAVFFDSLGIPWIYEPEGVRLKDGSTYLPDFFLPDCKQFFEVKGVLSKKDFSKIEGLTALGYSVTTGFDDGKFISCDNWGKNLYAIAGPAETHLLCRCRYCQKYWFMAANGSYVCQCCGEYDGDGHFCTVMEWCDRFSDTKLWDVARQARFEHGEQPVIRR